VQRGNVDCNSVWRFAGKCCENRCGNVRKCEHGTKIVFWKFDTYETETADGETEERKSAFLRYYVIFNLEQTEGLKALLALPPARLIESASSDRRGNAESSLVPARLSRCL
jgi:antirestriction protein ArdC